MTVWLWAVLGVRAAAGANAPLVAPPAPSLDLFAGIEFRPAVGDWAEYELRRRKQPKERVRVAVVGREEEPEPAFWIEFAANRAGQQLLVKLLTRRHPGEPGAILRMVVQLAPGMVIEFPVPPEEGASEAPPRPSVDGSARVSTRAGTFQAKRLRGARGGLAYVADRVPIFGLVRGESGEGVVELVAFGGGATSQITEEPQRMGIPFFPGTWTEAARSRDGGSAP